MRYSRSSFKVRCWGYGQSFITLGNGLVIIVGGGYENFSNDSGSCEIFWKIFDEYEKENYESSRGLAGMHLLRSTLSWVQDPPQTIGDVGKATRS